MAKRSARPGSNGTRCMFWKLPLEVRDMIYELLYGRHEVIKVIIRRDWGWREKDRRKEYGRNLITRPFPESLFGNFLVSKQYFDEATRIYMKTKTFRLFSSYQINEFVGPEKAVQRRIANSVQSVEIANHPPGEFYVFSLLPNLSYLTVLVEEENLDAGHNKVPWLDEYSDLDIISMPFFQDLSKIRGLKEMKLSGRDLQMAKTQQDKKMWSKLLQRINVLLQAETSKPKKEGDENDKMATFLNTLGFKSSFGLRQPSDYDFSKTGKASRPVLSDKEIPNTENGFAELFLSRPHDLFAWAKDIKRRVAILSTSTQV